SRGSFGELEELGFRQVWEIQFLRERAKPVLLDDSSAIGLNRQVNNFGLQIERIRGFDGASAPRSTGLPLGTKERLEASDRGLTLVREEILRVRFRDHPESEQPVHHGAAGNTKLAGDGGDVATPDD